MIGLLPDTLAIDNREYSIRSDYRNVLQILEAFNDAELTVEEKWIVAIYMIFKDFSCADDVVEAFQNGFDLEESIKQISWFISAGKKGRNEKESPVYDWIQDEQMIFSSINHVAGKEVRELEYMHWWTFLGYFNEIGEGTFSYIVGIRNKLNKGKKLDKHEIEFYRKNKDLVKITPPKTEEELRQEEENNALVNEILGL